MQRQHLAAPAHCCPWARCHRRNNRVLGVENGFVTTAGTRLFQALPDRPSSSTLLPLPRPVFFQLSPIHWSPPAVAHLLHVLEARWHSAACRQLLCQAQVFTLLTLGVHQFSSWSFFALCVNARTRRASHLRVLPSANDRCQRASKMRVAVFMAHLQPLFMRCDRSATLYAEQLAVIFHDQFTQIFLADEVVLPERCEKVVPI